MDWGAEKAGVLIKTWMQVTAGDTCRVPLQGGARREKAAQAEHSPFKSAGEAAGRFLGAPLGRSQRLGTDATWRKTPRRLRRTLSLGRGKAGCPSPICGLCPQATKHLPRAHDGRWPQGGVDTSPGVPGIGKSVAEAVVPRVQDPPPPRAGDSRKGSLRSDTVVLTAATHHSERTQSTARKGTRRGSDTQGNQAQASRTFSVPPPPRSCDHTCHRLSPQKFMREQCPAFFLGGCSRSGQAPSAQT